MSSPGLIDLHAHVLPGVDDGPPTVAAALELARAMVDRGVQTVVATSHVSERYRNDAATLAGARASLAETLRTEGIPLTVLPGAEVALDRALAADAPDLGELRLGGGPYLLVEAPLSPAVAEVEGPVLRVLELGHRVVLAHPERSPALQRSPGQLEQLVSRGVLTAVTAGAIAGRFGRHAESFAHRMLCDGMVHVVASDAHDLAGRQPGLVADLEGAAARLPGLEELIPWLTVDAPAAILAGTPLGPPPAAVRRLETPEPAGPLWRRLRLSGGAGRRRPRRRP